MGLVSWKQGRRKTWISQSLSAIEARRLWRHSIRRSQMSWKSTANNTAMASPAILHIIPITPMWKRVNLNRKMEPQEKKYNELSIKEMEPQTNKRFLLTTGEESSGVCNGQGHFTKLYMTWHKELRPGNQGGSLYPVSKRAPYIAASNILLVHITLS